MLRQEIDLLLPKTQIQLDDKGRGDMPGDVCVYFISDQNTNELLYVGSTGNLKKRIGQHRATKKDISNRLLSWLPSDSKEVRLLELHYTQAHQPKWNAHVGVELCRQLSVCDTAFELAKRMVKAKDNYECYEASHLRYKLDAIQSIYAAYLIASSCKVKHMNWEGFRRWAWIAGFHYNEQLTSDSRELSLVKEAGLSFNGFTQVLAADKKLTFLTDANNKAVQEFPKDTWAYNSYVRKINNQMAA